MRRTGKVGELSCGYGAGGGAVQAFASNMGVEMTEGEATKLVYDWRDANPNIIEFWDNLDRMLHDVVTRGAGSTAALAVGNSMVLSFSAHHPPESLDLQAPGTVMVQMSLRDSNGRTYLLRYFHGCYVRGRNICYHKPSQLKTGELWKNNFVDPKTKQRRFYELYGGKLAGILTQSFCRELFMHALEVTSSWCAGTERQVDLIGQFHDEIVLDWKPGAITLGNAKRALNEFMSDPGSIIGFPMAADIKDDYRYTK
jgi:hypothetical protein